MLLFKLNDVRQQFVEVHRLEVQRGRMREMLEILQQPLDALQLAQHQTKRISVSSGDLCIALNELQRTLDATERVADFVSQ